MLTWFLLVENWKKNGVPPEKKVNLFVWLNTIDYWDHADVLVIQRTVNIFQSPEVISMSSFAVEIRYLYSESSTAPLISR